METEREHIVCRNLSQVKEAVAQLCETTITQFSQLHHGKNYGKGMFQVLNWNILFSCYCYICFLSCFWNKVCHNEKNND